MIELYALYIVNSFDHSIVLGQALPLESPLGGFLLVVVGKVGWGGDP